MSLLDEDILVVFGLIIRTLTRECPFLIGTFSLSLDLYVQNVPS